MTVERIQLNWKSPRDKCWGRCVWALFTPWDKYGCKRKPGWDVSWFTLWVFSLCTVGTADTSCCFSAFPTEACRPSCNFWGPAFSSPLPCLLVCDWSSAQDWTCSPLNHTFPFGICFAQSSTSTISRLIRPRPDEARWRSFIPDTWNTLQPVPAEDRLFVTLPAFSIQPSCNLDFLKLSTGMCSYVESFVSNLKANKGEKVRMEKKKVRASTHIPQHGKR